MIHIIPVPTPGVARHWQQVAPLIERALPYSRGRFTLNGISADLQEGDKDLWMIYRDADLIAAVVTVYTDFARLKLCTVLLCGGDDVDEWVVQVLRSIETAARRDGCGQIEIIGRPGWQRKCPDYDVAGLWLVKELEAA